jgi:hypothetical protein
MHRNIINGRLVIHGCIHGLENECDVFNRQLGDCEIECENKVVWRCPYLYLEVREMGK